MTQQPVQGPHLRPENLLSQNPNAMVESAVLYSPPTLGYYWGWIGTYEPDRIPRMLKEVGERTAKLALRSFETAIMAMGVHEPGPQDRLDLYRVKSPDLWREQSMKFPWRFERDMQDWEKLGTAVRPPPPKTLAEVTE